MTMVEENSCSLCSKWTKKDCFHKDVCSVSPNFSCGSSIYLSYPLLAMPDSIRHDYLCADGTANVCMLIDQLAVASYKGQGPELWLPLPHQEALIWACIFHPAHNLLVTVTEKRMAKFFSTFGNGQKFKNCSVKASRQIVWSDIYNFPKSWADSVCTTAIRCKFNIKYSTKYEFWWLHILPSAIWVTESSWVRIITLFQLWK